VTSAGSTGANEAPAARALRIGVSLVLASLLTALGALVLGEYEFTGAMPFVAGPLFGLVIGELVLTVARMRSWPLAAAAACLAALGLLGAGWIDADEGVEPISGLVWPAMALGAVAAVISVGERRERVRPDE
jgi:hypothetical protein